MDNTSFGVVIMAAGKGTRLKSRRPKVLHEIGGRSLLHHVIAAAETVVPADHIYCVIGHEAESVRAAVAHTGVGFVLRADQRGTGHALQMVKAELALNGTPKDGSAATDFGTWTFGNPLSSGLMVDSQLSHAGGGSGSISPRFYGPDGEEIGGSFFVRNGAQGAPNTVLISGATVAKRQ